MPDGFEEMDSVYLFPEESELDWYDDDWNVL